MSTMQEQLDLNANLITAVLEIVDFYSKKGVFKIEEYKNIAMVNERLTEVKKGYESDSPYTPLNTDELTLVVGIFRAGTQRIPTDIESFGQIFGIYQHFKKVLEQELEAKKTENVPLVEELN